MALPTLPNARTALLYAVASGAAIFVGAFMPVRTINADPASAHVNTRPAPIEVVADPTPAPIDTEVGLIDAACVTIDAELYPCPEHTIDPSTGERAMGVRW